MQQFEIIIGDKLKAELQNLPDKDLVKIMDFINHLKINGFNDLEGRNKKSDNVPTDDPKWQHKVSYAQQHNLWHYHIGIPEYKISESGDFVSEYILHYQLIGKRVKIVDFSAHPPFRLPSSSYLE